MTINDYAIRETPNVKPRTILSQAYLYRKVQRLFRKEVRLEVSTNWKCQDINTQIIIYWRLFVEIFKDIKGLEGKYQISNIGTVKRILRKIKCVLI